MDIINTNISEKTTSDQKVADPQMGIMEQNVNYCNSNSNIESQGVVQNSSVISQIVNNDLAKGKDNSLCQQNIDDLNVQNFTEIFPKISSNLTKSSNQNLNNDAEAQPKTEIRPKIDNDLSKAETKVNLLNSFGQCLNVEATASEENLITGGNISKPIVKVQMPLCADYRSDSGSDSVDSESDSPASATESSTSSESEDSDSDDSGTFKSGNESRNRNSKIDMIMEDLLQIEDLKISVPEDACAEIGTVSSIVDNLVVVESYKGTAALDIDTVLFLNNGKKTLGRIYEILGPVSEPVYVVKFKSQDHIKTLKIEKGLKVYYAPKTEHTSFVFLSEVMKNRGSDASWKDNIEAPLEFQDFSDDEEERRCRKGNNSEGSNDPHSSRKRPFHRTGAMVQPRRFKRPEFHQQEIVNAGRLNPPNRFRPSHPVNSYATPNPPPTSFTFNTSPHPDENFINSYPTPPQTYFPPRFSGPPFPTFGVFPYGNFQRLFYQQSTHAFHGNFWRGPAISPPPPPPPFPSSHPFPPPTKD